MNFSWSFCGRVVYSASQWGILVLLAKLGTPDIVGEFGLTLAITSPLVIFLNLNLRALIATDLKKEYTIQDYVNLRNLSNLLFILLVCVVCAISGYGSRFIALVVTMGTIKSVEGMSDILYGINQKHERLDRVAQSLIIKGMLGLSFVAVALFFERSLFLVLFAMLLSCILVLIGWDLPSAKRFESVRLISGRVHYENLVRIALHAAPLGVVGTVVSLKTNIPRYFVEGYFDSAMLGYFTAISYFSLAGDTIIMSLSHASMPRLAKYYNNNMKAFVRLLVKLFGVAFGLGLLALTFVMLCGKPFLSIVYSVDYARYSNVLVLIMVAGMGAYVSACVGTAVIVMRKLKAWAVVTVISTITCLVCSWLFVKPLGLAGGAVAMIVASWLNAFLGGVIVVTGIRKKRVGSPPS
jgi:O-antigen/teichoic acid export membrane protein